MTLGEQEFQGDFPEKSLPLLRQCRALKFNGIEKIHIDVLFKFNKDSHNCLKFSQRYLQESMRKLLKQSELLELKPDKVDMKLYSYDSKRGLFSIGNISKKYIVNLEAMHPRLVQLRNGAHGDGPAQESHSSTLASIFSGPESQAYQEHVQTQGNIGLQYS